MAIAMRTGIVAVLFTFYAASGRAGSSSTGQPKYTTQASPTQTTAASSSPKHADVAPLASPAMVGPLTAASPTLFDAGPFGRLAVNGVLSGFGVWQDNPVQTDRRTSADISNGQIFLQKATGLMQFYIQAGASNFPSLGTPILSTHNNISYFYGALPMAYIKLAPTGSLSFMAGKLPSLIGAEDIFTFQNATIERGLLWNQENAITRGVQANYTVKKLSGSMSWSDGFYSNRWNWLTGSLTYAFGTANSLGFVVGGNLGHSSYSTIATPANQNNSSIYNLIYTHTAKRWMIQPYFQYTYVPTYLQIGVSRATSTRGEAISGSYTLPHHMFLAGRLEYISSTGSLNDGSANLLYGPGSSAGSVTITPTYQNKSFFTRGEVSFIRAGNYTPGDAFGTENKDGSQARCLMEAGFLF